MAKKKCTASYPKFDNLVILKTEVKSLILDSMFNDPYNYNDRIKYIISQALEVIDKCDIDLKTLLITKELFPSPGRYTFLKEEDEVEEMFKNKIFHSIGLGEAGSQTNALILAVMYHQLNNKYRDIFQSYIEEALDDLRFYIRDNIDLVNFKEIKNDIEKSLSSYIENLQLIFSKEMNVDDTIQSIRITLKDLWQDIQIIGEKINKRGSYLGKCKYEEVNSSVYVECVNDEVFKLRIEMPSLFHKKYLHGKSERIKAVLCNEEGKMLKCVIRRGTYGDYSGYDDLYIVIKYSDYDNLLRNEKIASFNFELHLIIADKLSGNYKTYFDFTQSKNLPDVYRYKNKIMYKTDLKIDLEKILK